MLRPVPDLPEPERGCPLGICAGDGWVEVESTGEVEPCRCRERRIRQAARRLGSGIPRRYQGVSFDRRPIVDIDPYIQRHVRRFVEQIGENVDAGRGLWFHGDIGTGKTSLAMLISKAAQEAGRSVAVYSVPRLLAEIKDTYDADSVGSYMDLFRRLCAVDLLHLDDLGAERSTEWVLEQLYSIVNERWQDQRAIVVTTNLPSLDDLRRQVGDRTVSRLREICGDPLLVMGEDLRRAEHGS